jgi:hypothetical protein
MFDARFAEEAEGEMKGLAFDAGLVVALLVAFFVVAGVHPGLANGLIAVLGLIGLGWYDAVVRHDRSGSLRPAWQLTKASESTGRPASSY